MRTLIILLTLIVIPSAALAAPKPRTPAMRLCMDASGGIVTRKKCKSFETTLSGQHLQALAGFGPKGEKGDPGPAGQDGTLNPNRCFKREAHASGAAYSVVAVTAACLNGEFLVTTGCTSTSPLGYVRDTILDTGTEAFYPGTYGILTCIWEDWHGVPHTVTAQALCCQP